MGTSTRRAFGAVLAFVALTTMAIGCTSSGSDTKTSTKDTSSSGGGGTSSSLDAIRVPQDHKTIAAALEAAKSGDLILVDEGVYHEALDVTTPDITIRGVDRNKVILDGQFKLENGIRILDTDGVVVENMTARNYLSNGFYWTGSDRYRGSYLTAYRNGDYGVYAFDAYHGQFDHSTGWGSPDAGFYIGECYKCDAVVDHVDSQYNGLGYSGTNSGGDLYLINSNWANNRAGMVPNSGSYELCYPSRGTTVIGNTVHDNNYLKGPGIDVSLLAQGNGILLAGAIDADVERNLVYNHDRTGIAAVPFPEDDANDNPPPASEHDTPCDETKDKKLPNPKDVPGTVLWNPTGNRFVGNVVSGSGLADLASATVPIEDVAGLNNCFSGNTFATTAPKALEALAPCDAKGNGGSFTDGALDLGPLIADQPPKPAKNSYRKTPVPPAQANMPDALTAKAEKFTGPTKPDLHAIKVPSKP
ncbi:MAG: hypothetical protein JWM89_872 [Acidimicrobiales bacterium]|nr:hypothetical protein [Acidimicrobiales bacterium]